MKRASALLLAATLALPAMAVVLLATAGPTAAQEADAEAFQRLTHGLGLGASVDLSRCAPAFDPRDGGACSSRHEPVPCGSLFCPAHSGG